MPDIKPISDDQELAKVLAGVSNDDTMNQAAETDSVSTLPPVPAAPADDSGAAQPAADQSQTSPEPETLPAPDIPPVAPVDTSNLESIKAAALQELRPLVDKLNVTPQEKFDVLLLLLRSTDDSSLVEQAHAAAKDIVDETTRAQALLDVIKEIDFLSNPNPQQ